MYEKHENKGWTGHCILQQIASMKGLEQLHPEKI
jgi:hypothetical protein